MLNSQTAKQAKIISTALIFSAIALQLWQLVAPIPHFLQLISSITQVVLIIHAAEGIVGAILIALYKIKLDKIAPHEMAPNGQYTEDKPAQAGSNLLTNHLPKSTPLAVLKAGLYAFFVGTVGLAEIASEVASLIKKESAQTF